MATDNKDNLYQDRDVLRGLIVGLSILTILMSLWALLETASHPLSQLHLFILSGPLFSLGAIGVLRSASVLKTDKRNGLAIANVCIGTMCIAIGIVLVVRGAFLH